MKRILPLFLSLSAASLLLTVQAHAQDTTPVAAAPVQPLVVEPAVAALLDKSGKAYANIKGLSLHLSAESHVLRHGPETKDDDVFSKSEGDLRFGTPDKLWLKVANVNNSPVPPNNYTTHIVVKGKKTWSQIPTDPLQYMERTLRDTDDIYSVMGSLDSLTHFPFVRILRGNNVLKTVYQWETATAVSANVVKLTAHTGKASNEFTLTFDPTDNLIRQIEAMRSIEIKGITSVNTTKAIFSDVKVNPTFSEADFIYTPNPGATIFTPGSQLPYNPKLVVGAQPFALQSPDMEGKTPTWDKYKGKVVLLDFWATWCGPCIAELPNVLKNYKTYHDQGFEIVGVSLDENKKAVTDFIKTHNISYTNLFDGKGWKNADATQYAVTGIPFSLLIGKDGNIAAIDPRGEKLEPAIKAALAK